MENVIELEVITGDSADLEASAELLPAVKVNFQQKALEAGYSLAKLQLAVDLRNKLPRIEINRADVQVIGGTIQPSGGTKVYDPEVDFTDASKCRCACGYYLPYKSNDRKKLCTHQILLLLEADGGREIIAASPKSRRTPGQPSQTNTVTTASAEGESAKGKYSFQGKIHASISKAIGGMKDEVLATLERGKIPFLLGPTGCGKTSCIDLIVKHLGFGYETIGGMESYADGDIVGLFTSRGPIKGIVARAFERARNGEKMIIFVDEFPRFDSRVQNLFMLALLPRSADIAKALGIDVDSASGYEDGDKVFITEAPVWGVEWAPAKNVIWIFGGNTWGAKFDPAFVRRVQPMYVSYSEDVLKPFGVEMADFIRTTWQMCSDGTLPLPVEYGMIAGMRNAVDVSIFADYLQKLRLLDQSFHMMVSQMIPEFSNRAVNAAEAAANN